MNILKKLIILVNIVFTSSISLGKEINIITYNIFGGRLTSIDEIAHNIKKYSPDFISLQEVDKNTKRSKFKDMTKEIAEILGYKEYYFQKTRDYDGGEFGISFISKYPVEKMYIYELYSEGIEKRHILAAQFYKNDFDKVVTVINTHLDYKDKLKEKEINELLSIIDKFEGDIKILTGDLNLLPTSNYYEKILEKWNDTYIFLDDKYFDKDIEKNRIDYIFTNEESNIKVKSSEFLKGENDEWKNFSDHMPYRVILDIN